MGFFSGLFKKKETNQTETAAVVRFGRFAEPFETDELYSLRTSADDLYKEGRMLEAYVTYFNYMSAKGGPAVKLAFNEEIQTLRFEIIQGSKIVVGFITPQDIIVKADVAEFSEINVALMRFLLNQNAELAYSKFAIDENTIFLKQSCPIKDMSPNTFNNMLAETAIAADSVDDVLVKEFSFLKPVNVQYVVNLPQNEIDAKLKFIRSQISFCNETVESTNDENTRTYIILSCVFKLLWLVSPEGILLDELRKIQDIYAENFDAEQNNSPEINFKMLQALDNLSKQSDDELRAGLYTVCAVFPELSYVPFSDTAQAVETLLQLPQACINSRRDDLAGVMCEYIAGLICVRQGMNPVAYEMITIFWRTLYSDYFYQLGFKEMFYNQTAQKLSAVKISQETEKVVRKCQRIFPTMHFNTANLDYGSLDDFAFSFLREFSMLNIAE